MAVPLNVLHYYLVFPVVVYLTFDNLLRYRKNQNLTTLYIGLATVCATIAMTAYGGPALFTRDSFILSIGTFVGDIFQPTMFLFFWLISIRAFLSHRPRAAKIATVLAFCLIISLMIEAIYRNFTPPYGTYIKEIGQSGRIALLYKQSLLYTILNSIDTLAFVIFGIYFWKQGKFAPNRAQRFRIRSFAIGLLFVALAFFVTPALPLDEQAVVSVGLFSLFPVSVVAGILFAAATKPKTDETNKPS